MLQIDQDQATETAAYLLRKVTRQLPPLPSEELKHAFRKKALEVLIEFLCADVPCGVKTTQYLFEEILEDTDFTIQRDITFPPVLNDALALAPRIQFQGISNMNAFPEIRHPDHQLQEIKNEILRARKAAVQNMGYIPNNLFNNHMSTHADQANRKVFAEYFESLRETVEAQGSDSHVLLEKLHQVMQKTRELQLVCAHSADTTPNPQPSQTF